VRAESHLVLVQGEVRHTAPELEELLAWLAVALILLHRILDRLLGQAVLQLEGGHGQAVDEEGHVERALSLVTTVAKLPRDAEPVGRVALLGLRVAGRGRAVEQIEVVRPVLDPMAQHGNGPALRNLSLQPSKKLAAHRAVLVELEGRGRLRLRFAEEGRELGEVDAVLAVVVLGCPAVPTDAVGRGSLAYRSCRVRPGITRRAGQRRADQPLEAALAGVGRHRVQLARIKPPRSKPFLASTSRASAIWRGENRRLRSFQP
jgi:hypothetical protein